MSLKLGNTNIAGTQVLYSTTGNNTDGAMTQAVTTSQLILKANDADVIHKTGDESYTGLKTNIVTIDLSQRNYTSCNVIKTNMDATVVQPFYQDFYSDVIFDVNNNFFSWNATVIGSDKSVNKQMAARCKNTANTGDVTGIIKICVSPNGSTWATAPASDINDSIVTTVNKSKATNGYFQLGNGLIINWGRTSNAQQTNVTFSKAYSSADSYAVIAVPYTSSNSNKDGYSCYITNLSSTGCTIWNKMYGSDLNAIKHWIAIGY